MQISHTVFFSYLTNIYSATTGEEVQPEEAINIPGMSDVLAKSAETMIHRDTDCCLILDAIGSFIDNNTDYCMVFEHKTGKNIPMVDVFHIHEARREYDFMPLKEAIEKGCVLKDGEWYYADSN